MEDTLRDYGTDFRYDAVLACLALRWFRKSRFDQSFGDFLSRFLVVAFLVILHDVAEQLRIRNVLDRVMEARKLRCSRLTDIRNRQGEEPTRKRQCSRSLDRVNCFRGVLFSEDTRRLFGAEIQFGQLLDV